MTILYHVAADCRGNSHANPWAFRDPSGRVLGYSLPREQRVAIYRMDRTGGAAEFVGWEPEPAPDASRAQWLHWHRTKEARDAADNRPARPFDYLHFPETPARAPAPAERSATMTRADMGMGPRHLRKT